MDSKEEKKQVPYCWNCRHFRKTEFFRGTCRVLKEYYGKDNKDESKLEVASNDFCFKYVKREK